MKTKQAIELLTLMRMSPIPVGATQLSEKTGIPSATVGRILARLEKEHKVEKVSNRGRQLTKSGEQYLETVTIHSSKMNVADQLICLIRENSLERMLEIQRTRRLLESYTVEIAAKEPTAEDINILEDILHDYIYEVKHGNPHSETDIRLHLHIAKMSGNAVIQQILMLILQGDNRYYSQLSEAMKQSTAERIQQHRNIVEAIKEKNPKKAVAAMTTHLETIFSKSAAPA